MFYFLLDSGFIMFLFMISVFHLISNWRLKPLDLDYKANKLKNKFKFV